MAELLADLIALQGDTANGLLTVALALLEGGAQRGADGGRTPWGGGEVARLPRTARYSLVDMLYRERAIELAGLAFGESAQRARDGRSEIEVDGAACIVDASMISPAFRRL